jgi:hypothetical protein
LQANGRVLLERTIEDELNPSGASGASSGELRRSLEDDGATTRPKLRSRAEKQVPPGGELIETMAAENTSVAGVQRSPRICSGDM